MVDLIEKKRDGGTLSYDELKFIVQGFTEGIIPDYQVAAFLMAAYIRTLSDQETYDLTRLMADTGEKVDLSSIKGIVLDKHSTGGVGDKTTLIVAPLAAACGVQVAKMSGRSLGHTGGTIDKLESIPGFRTNLDIGEFISNIKKIGLAITSQSENLAPADKKFYELRDVTGTVESPSLIAASIMSKKLASGADKIVLDVKTGSGAFMKTLDEAITLARMMINIGKSAQKEIVAYVTDMDTPLGNYIGNALEVIEAIEVLKGRGPKDITELSVELAARMVEMSTSMEMDECREKVRNAILNQSGLNKFREMVLRQGGNPEVIEDYSLLEKALYSHEIRSVKEGYVEKIRTDRIGKAVKILGAGRETKEDTIDYSAGIELKVKPGMKVKQGDVIAKLYTNNEGSIKESESIVLESYLVSEQKPPVRPLILAYVDQKNTFKYVDK